MRTGIQIADQAAFFNMAGFQMNDPSSYQRFGQTRPRVRAWYERPFVPSLAFDCGPRMEIVESWLSVGNDSVLGVTAATSLDALDPEQ